MGHVILDGRAVAGMLIGPATESACPSVELGAVQTSFVFSHLDSARFVEKMSLPPFSDGHQPWYAGSTWMIVSRIVV